ncbi:MAG: glycosyltransferase [Pseudomonadota bacterium]
MAVSVSIVLCSHKDSELIDRSLQSVITQTYTDFEVVVVGDGDPPGLEGRCSSHLDRRIRYVPIIAGGLTKALIHGIECAKGEYVARLDVGDEMRCDRLEKQLTKLSDRSDIGMVSSNFGMYTVDGDFLYKTNYSTKTLRNSLLNPIAPEFELPIHASVTFRKNVYQSAGGYREEFYYAQDCDLWLRMGELCLIDNIDEVLTDGLFLINGISATKKTLQEQYKQLAIDSAMVRRSGQGEDNVLNSGLTSTTLKGATAVETLIDNTDFYYFVAKCLYDNRNPRDSVYLAQVLRNKPWHLRGLLLWIRILYRRLML